MTMAANTNPVFGLTAVAKTVAVSAATTDNPVRAGTGNSFGTILTAGVNGTRIDRIVAEGTAQTAAGQLLLFINDGTTNWFFQELTIPATTASTTVSAGRTELVRTDGLPLVAIPSGYSLKCCLTVAVVSGVVNVTAFGADF